MQATSARSGVRLRWIMIAGRCCRRVVTPLNPLRAACSPEGGRDDVLRRLLDPGQVLGAAEALGVDLETSSVPHDRAATTPPSVTTLSPPSGAPLPGGAGQQVDDLLAGQFGDAHVVAENLPSFALSSELQATSVRVGRLAEPLGELPVVLARRPAGHRPRWAAGACGGRSQRWPGYRGEGGPGQWSPQVGDGLGRRPW
jgi:hypothetical protein